MFGTYQVKLECQPGDDLALADPFSLYRREHVQLLRKIVDVVVHRRATECLIVAKRSEAPADLGRRRHGLHTAVAQARLAQAHQHHVISAGFVQQWEPFPADIVYLADFGTFRREDD
ncbi:MAG: hypothetical protein DLM61_02220 [Pseudonocardiales bacterium]|nr:MAG: hypothetical protein DLM61_02220 [Pseudonocardiales bacterium]